MTVLLPLPDRSAVHLHKITFVDPGWDRPDFEEDLDARERARASAFVFAEHRRNFLIAHGFLRHVLAAYLGCAPGDLQFGTTATGKPLLKGLTPGSPLSFNLSHTRNHAVLVVGLCPKLGVDIEERNERRSITEISQRYFAPSERTALSRASSQERADTFLRIWTRKEAILKATGYGLSLPLAQVSVSPGDHGPMILSLPRACGDPAEWSVIHLDFGDQCLGAIAVRELDVALDLIDHRSIVFPKRVLAQDCPSKG